MLLDRVQSLLENAGNSIVNDIEITPEIFTESMVDLEREYLLIESATLRAELDLEREAATLGFKQRLGMTEGLRESAEKLVAMNENVFQSALTKVKEFFKKVKEKLIALFNHMMSFFNQVFMKDSDFVKKYEKVLEEKDDDKFEFEALPWDTAKLEKLEGEPSKFIDAVSGEGSVIVKDALTLSVKGMDEKALTDAKTAYTTFKTNRTKIEDEVRGKVIKGSGALKSDKVHEALVETVWGKKSVPDKKSYTKGFSGFVQRSTMLASIKEGTKEDIKTIEEFRKNVKDAYDKIIEDIDKMQDDQKDSVADDDAKRSEKKTVVSNVHSAYTGLAKVWSDAYTSRINFTIQTMKQRKDEYRRILMEFFRYKPVKESAGFAGAATSDDLLEKYM